FVYLIVVGALVAYVTGRALAPASSYLAVFRIAGATAFIAHAVADWPASIWYKRAWSTTLKNTFDGLVYGLLTAGTFGWLWPRCPSAPPLRRRRAPPAAGPGSPRSRAGSCRSGSSSPHSTPGSRRATRVS